MVKTRTVRLHTSFCVEFIFLYVIKLEVWEYLMAQAVRADFCLD
jgi:hypothetical protein